MSGHVDGHSNFISSQSIIYLKLILLCSRLVLIIVYPHVVLIPNDLTLTRKPSNINTIYVLPAKSNKLKTIN